MPANMFSCPDGERILINKCLEKGGCRMSLRCATLPYLRACSFDREFRGVSPSMAGNGPRQIYLKATCNYTINPYDRVWALLGTGTHDKLAMHKYTDNVLSEEKMSDEQIAGIADVLEEDEIFEGAYILTDYKSSGSYKVMKWLGIYKENVPSLDEQGKEIYYKSGKKKGELRTHQEIRVDPDKADLSVEELQLNAYRILFENNGFSISQIRIQAIPRDGNTHVARGRGIDKNMYMIPVKRLHDEEVRLYYALLAGQVADAFEENYARLCNDWENWDGRRCQEYCEVAENCKNMSVKNKEDWVL